MGPRCPGLSYRRVAGTSCPTGSRQTCGHGCRPLTPSLARRFERKRGLVFVPCEGLAVVRIQRRRSHRERVLGDPVLGREAHLQLRADEMNVGRQIENPCDVVVVLRGSDSYEYLAYGIVNVAGPELALLAHARAKSHSVGDE